MPPWWVRVGGCWLAALSADVERIRIGFWGLEFVCSNVSRSLFAQMLQGFAALRFTNRDFFGNTGFGAEGSVYFLRSFGDRILGLWDLITER